MTLGERLKELRQQTGFSQEQVAERVGVSRQTINAMESARYVPSTVLALKVARVFSVPVEQVFTLEEGD